MNSSIVKKRCTGLILVCVMMVNVAVGQDKHGLTVINAYDLGLYHEDKTQTKKEFLGLFFKRNLSITLRRQEFELKKIQLSDYRDYKKVESDSLLFIFSGFDFFKTKIKGWSPDFYLRSLFPGESFFFQIGENTYHFYAKGEIVNNTDPGSLEVFDGIKNYKIGVKADQNGKITDQIIMEFPYMERWNIGNYLGGIVIQWVGDLNGDGKLDIIMSTSGHHECYNLVLIMTDAHNKFQQVYNETYCGG